VTSLAGICLFYWIWTNFPSQKKIPKRLRRANFDGSFM